MDIDALWDFADPAASEARFRDALSDASEAVRLEILTQVARTHSLRGQFQEAHEVLQSIPVDGLEGRAKVRWHLELGRTLNSSGEKQEASRIFEIAYQLALMAREDALAVDAAHMVAIATHEETMQLHWNQLGLELAQRSSDSKAQKWRASLLNNLGWAHHDAGRFEDALACFEEAHALRASAGQGAQERIARWTIARCLRSLGRIDEALAIQQALKLEDPADPYIDEEIAELTKDKRGDVGHVES